MPKSKVRKPKRRKTIRKEKKYTKPLAFVYKDISKDLVNDSFAYWGSAYRNKWISDILGKVVPDTYSPGITLDSIAAVEYLHEIRKNLEKLAGTLAQTYSSNRWFWYARRVDPKYFRGHLTTTEVTDQSIFETLGSLSTSTERMNVVEGKSIVYPMDPQSLKPVVQMALLASLLGHTHACIRRANKGTNFVVVKNDTPTIVEDKVLEKAISLYDRRVELAAPAWSAALDTIGHQSEKEIEDAIIGVGKIVPRDGAPAVSYGWRGPLIDKPKFMEVEGNYGFHFLSLSSLFDTIDTASQLGDSADWWNPQLPSLLAFMKVLSHELLVHGQNIGVSIPSVGYVNYSERRIIESLEDWLPYLKELIEDRLKMELPKSGKTILEEVKLIKGSLWPYELGPIIRENQPLIQIDLFSALSTLTTMSTIPARIGGGTVNIPANKFELAVQKKLSDSPYWAPEGRMKILRGKTLTKEGKSFTDIDAIGTHDDQLLIVSCKNINYTSSYNAGEYFAIDNAEKKIASACQKLDTLLAELTVSPKAGNFDFSGYNTISGVVITPHVIYTKDPTYSVEIARNSQGDPLYKSSSFGELVKYIAHDLG